MQIYLTTNRLLLRQFMLADADNLYALDGDPEVMRFINGGVPTPYDVVRDQTLPRLLDDNHRARDDGYGYWAAVEQGSGRFVGWFHFRPAPDRPADDAIELGYRLCRAAWGQGYATEGARALIRKGFTELGTPRVVANTLARNIASRRVMEKAGLRFARAFHYTGAPGAWHVGQEAVEYALDRADWTPAAITEGGRRMP